MSETLTPAEAFQRVGWTEDAAPADPRLPDAATMDALRAHYDAIVQRRRELADAALAATAVTSSSVVAVSSIEMPSTSPYRVVLSA